MSIPLFTVDSFTAERFAGNPAGVCLLSAPREAAWMQHVAREMNLAETAFLVPQPKGFDLRWFTPRIEVALCGHATLASAHILWENGIVSIGQPIAFFSRSGVLGAKRNGEWIELDFPARPAKQAPPPQQLDVALGVKPAFVGRSVDDYLVVVDQEGTVRSVAPNFSLLRELGVRGVIVTARSDNPQFDFVSRFFAPGAGIDEDPVTGSAHCTLAPYWQTQLQKDEMSGYQASERGGVVRVRVVGDRILLGGQAVTILRGQLDD